MRAAGRSLTQTVTRAAYRAEPRIQQQERKAHDVLDLSTLWGDGCRLASRQLTGAARPSPYPRWVGHALSEG